MFQKFRTFRNKASVHFKYIFQMLEDSVEKKKRKKRRFIKNDSENDKQQIIFQQNDICSKPYFLVFHL